MKVNSQALSQCEDGGTVPRVRNAQSVGNLKLIQCQLMLLLHARRCQQRHDLVTTKTNSGSNVEHQPIVSNSLARTILLNCPVRHCRAMKEVLNHMKSCQLGSTCDFYHCSSSLRILSHWTNCVVHDCPLCQCVRDRMKMAKEWEASLPRNSRYTLLAAALRSSQVTRLIPPNCSLAEQAEEGQSGTPCENQAATEELRRLQGDSDIRDKPLRKDYKRSIFNLPSLSTPLLDQVRKAYEQLGIPCPDEALARLMATHPALSFTANRPLGHSSDPPLNLVVVDNTSDSTRKNSQNENSLLTMTPRVILRLGRNSADFSN